MIKKIIGLFALIIYSLTGFSQSLTITDIELQPIAEVELFSEDNSIYAVTNLSGIADVSKFKNCASISIMHNGYATVVTTYQALQVKGFKLYLYEKTETLNAVVVAANKFDEKA